MTLASNSKSVTKAVERSWHEFPQSFDRRAVHLSVGMTPGGDDLVQPQYRTREHLLTIMADQDNCIVCDMATGFAFGWLTERVLSDIEFARFYYLDAAALSMVDQLHLAPIHAALVSKNGRGVLLCGDTFAGKSTLAYACARRGWTLTSDDGTFLVRERRDCYAIGNPHGIRLREEAKHLFPELAERIAARRVNGKMALEIPTSELDIETSYGGDVTDVIFLSRDQSSKARLISLSKEETLRRLDSVRHYGSQCVHVQRCEAYRRLLDCELLRLEYSGLDCAVAQLEELISD